jgi:hypothetical protein
VNACLTKYFGTPAITRNEAANVLKHLVWTPAGEVRRMGESGEFPACLKLLAGTLLDDLETGRTDTDPGISDYLF